MIYITLCTNIFLNILLEILNKHAPVKEKYIRANKRSFTPPSLHKDMIRSKLRNEFQQEKREISRRVYAKQRDHYEKLFRKTVKEYFADLKINLITDNRKACQTVKPLSSDKRKLKEIDNLVENETILQNNKSITDIFNKYFCNIAKNLSISKDPCFEDQHLNFCVDRVKAAIEKYIREIYRKTVV